jgi:hypothetical protein
MIAAIGISILALVSIFAGIGIFVGIIKFFLGPTK